MGYIFRQAISNYKGNEEELKKVLLKDKNSHDLAFHVLLVKYTIEKSLINENSPDQQKQIELTKKTDQQITEKAQEILDKASEKLSLPR